jgi:beta-lactamase regulating signal transducer with metallopeptidase domain
MTALIINLGPELMERLGWTLVHFLWQGTLIGLLTASLLASLHAARAQTRYLVACGGLLAMVVAPIATFLLLAPQQPTALATHAARLIDTATDVDLVGRAGSLRATGAGVASDAPGRTQEDGSARVSIKPRASAAGVMYQQARATIEGLLPWLVQAWAIGICALSLRLAGGLALVARLRRRTLQMPAIDVQQRLVTLAERVGLRRAIVLRIAPGAETPAVIGWWRPIILLPASALAGLAPAQLEAVLAHELAHVRRHDYLVNLLQSLAETLLFYHPAVWYVSHQIRVEREHCCDDEAVASCGDATMYASALAELETLRHAVPAFAMPALGSGGSSLLHRIRRLLFPATATRSAIAWPTNLALLTTTVVVISAFALHNAIAAAPAVSASASIGDDIDTQRQSPAELPAPPEPPTPAAREALPPAPAHAAARASQAHPAPPAPPAPPAAPAPPAPQSEHSEHSDTYTMQSSDGTTSLQIKGSGQVVFTDDDTDVKGLSDNGYLDIEERTSSGTVRIEFRSRAGAAGGGVERRWWKDGRAESFEPEGRAWLTRRLPDIIRRTGLGADTRIGRILQRQGPTGVLDEVSRLPSDYVKSRYLLKLFALDSQQLQQPRQPQQHQSPLLDTPLLTRLVIQTGREIKSEYSRSQVLRAVVERGVPADEVSIAYVDATRTMHSDFERQRDLASLVQAGPLHAGTLRALLETATTINSDYEKSRLLTTVVDRQSLDESSTRAYLAVVGAIRSDFERRRTLTALIPETATASPKSTKPLPDSTIRGILEAIGHTNSDYDKARVLIRLAETQRLDGDLRKQYLAAADNLKSGYERNRALAALAHNETAARN